MDLTIKMSSNEQPPNPLSTLEELRVLNCDAWETLRNVHPVDFQSLSEATADFGVRISQDILSNIGTKIANEPMLYSTDFMLELISHLRDKVRDFIRQQEYDQQPAEERAYDAPPRLKIH